MVRNPEAESWKPISLNIWSKNFYYQQSFTTIINLMNLIAAKLQTRDWEINGRFYNFIRPCDFRNIRHDRRPT